MVCLRKAYLPYSLPCLPAELGEVSIYVWINNRAGIPYRTFMLALISFNSAGYSFPASRSVECFAVLYWVQSLREVVVMNAVVGVFFVCLRHYVCGRISSSKHRTQPRSLGANKMVSGI